MPTSCEHLERPLGRLGLGDVLVEPHGSAIWRPIVMVGFSEVIGSWKIMATSLPRTSRICFSGSETSSLPVRFTEPPEMWPTFGQQLHDRETGGALAASGLADQSQALALADRERDAVDCPDGGGRR